MTYDYRLATPSSKFNDVILFLTQNCNNVRVSYVQCKRIQGLFSKKMVEKATIIEEHHRLILKDKLKKSQTNELSWTQCQKNADQ